MSLKGYRLWAMGQLDSTCRAPPLCVLLGTYSKCWNPTTSASCNQNKLNLSVVPTTSTV
jgi:hypothetical protein